MMNNLLEEITRTGSQFAILDITGVEVVDANTSHHLMRIMKAVELMGARPIITGIRPSVAQTVAGLGLDLSKIVTTANHQQGL